MKNKGFLYVGSLCLLFASCTAPRVLTDVVAFYPSVPIDSVHVFDLGDEVPNSAQAIGRVQVYDPGTAVKCNYDQVLYLAKEKTARAGGNGLLLTNHIEPSIWGSTCHQITGTMLRVTDWHIDSLQPNPVMEGVIAMKEEQRVRVEKARPPKNTLSVSAGWGWVTSKVATPLGSYRGKGGVEWGVEYNHVFNSGWGFGLQYAGFQVEFDRSASSTLTFIGPSLVYRGRFSDKWLPKMSLGIGYGGMSDNGFNTSGVGISYALGMEYMLSKSVGVGVELSEFVFNFSTTKEQQRNNERNGVARVSLTGGLRVYF
ncbi:MAG: porin family protein [Prevotellaceae bacterium]|jgi:hypothetical protein|nr:porin family protein [Prevotellaceae bacterium]